MYKINDLVWVKKVIPNPKKDPVFISDMDISKGHLYQIKAITFSKYLVLEVNNKTWNYHPDWVTSKPKLSFKTLKE